MHEASLMRDLMRKIETVARDAGSGKVTAIQVRLGALSHMSEDHFREHFDVSSAGTVAEGADLRVTVMSDTGHPEAQAIVLESVAVADP